MSLAYEIAEHYLDQNLRAHFDDEIVFVAVMDFDDYWAFGYNSRAFVENGDFTKSLVGNGPIVIPKDGTDPFAAASSSPLDQQLGPMLGIVNFTPRS